MWHQWYEMIRDPSTSDVDMANEFGICPEDVYRTVCCWMCIMEAEYRIEDSVVPIQPAVDCRVNGMDGVTGDPC